MPSIEAQIDTFLASPAFAVAGASTSREKYGNKVLRCYLQHDRKAIPVHPREPSIEGVACAKSIAELPKEVKSLSIVTPPPVTEQVVEAAIQHGIQNVWMQPGAESEKAVARCKEAGVNVIADGTCLLVVMGYHEHG